MRISGCMRTEKNDACRRKLVDDPLHVVSNLLGRDHSLNLGKACNRSRVETALANHPRKAADDCCTALYPNGEEAGMIKKGQKRCQDKKGEDKKGVRNLFLDGSRWSIRSGRCSAAGRGAPRIRSRVKALPTGAIQTRFEPAGVTPVLRGRPDLASGPQPSLRARLRRAGQPETAGSRAPAGAARARA